MPLSPEHFLRANEVMPCGRGLSALRLVKKFLESLIPGAAYDFCAAFAFCCLYFEHVNNNNIVDAQILFYFIFYVRVDLFHRHLNLFILYFSR